MTPSDEDIANGIRRKLSAVRKTASPRSHYLTATNAPTQSSVHATRASRGALDFLFVGLGLVLAFGALAATQAILGRGDTGVSTSAPGSVVVDVRHVASASPGQISVCEEALLVGQIHADRKDPWVTWMTGAGGDRVDVKWPASFSAEFSPEFALLDASRVVAKGGDTLAITGGFGNEENVFNACRVEKAQRPS